MANQNRYVSDLELIGMVLDLTQAVQSLRHAVMITRAYADIPENLEMEVADSIKKSEEATNRILAGVDSVLKEARTE